MQKSYLRAVQEVNYQKIAEEILILLASMSLDHFKKHGIKKDESIQSIYFLADDQKIEYKERYLLEDKEYYIEIVFQPIFGESPKVLILKGYVFHR